MEPPGEGTETVTGTLKHVKSSVARTGGIVLRWSSGYGAGGYSGFHFFLRKTLFDFIKSCGGRIDLNFSGVALLGPLYSPKWKRSFFSKGKVPFSMAGSLLRAVQESFSVKEIYRWKEDRFVFFMKKTIGPRIPSFSRKNQTKMVRKTEDDVP